MLSCIPLDKYAICISSGGNCVALQKKDENVRKFKFDTIIIRLKHQNKNLQFGNDIPIPVKFAL